MTIREFKLALWNADLSTRAFNVVHRALESFSPDELITDINLFLRVKECGKKTFDEIATWLEGGVRVLEPWEHELDTMIRSLSSTKRMQVKSLIRRLLSEKETRVND